MKTKFLTLLLLVTLAGCGGGDKSGSTFDGEQWTVTLDSFEVEPGEEVFRCQDFANPTGEDLDVVRWRSNMSSGSHHLLVFYQDNAKDTDLAPCSGLFFASTPYGAQGPEESLTYPDGVGALVKGNQGLRIQVHYLNASLEKLKVNVKVTMDVDADGQVTEHAGILFFNNLFLSVPPDNQPHTLTDNCTIPSDAKLLNVQSHMHQRATLFESTINGSALYDTTEWSHPEMKSFDPPLEVHAGDDVTWACTYVNDTDDDLTFGESAATDIMCIMAASFYPVAEGEDPTVGCF